MLKTVLVSIFSILLAIQVNSSNPHANGLAAIDDARADLEELRQMVLGAILAAEDELEALNSNFVYYADRTETQGLISLQYQEDGMIAELNTIKSLAASAQVDISSCLSGREEYLDKLFQLVYDELKECLFDEVKEASKVVENSKYLIDININRVDALDFQLGRCDSTSDSCISGIVQEIDLEKEKLPQNIQIELVRANEISEKLKVAVEECVDLKVTQYTTSSSTILKDITTCVDDLIN